LKIRTDLKRKTYIATPAALRLREPIPFLKEFNFKTYNCLECFAELYAAKSIDIQFY